MTMFSDDKLIFIDQLLGEEFDRASAAQSTGGAPHAGLQLVEVTVIIGTVRTELARRGIFPVDTSDTELGEILEEGIGQGHVERVGDYYVLTEAGKIAQSGEGRTMIVDMCWTFCDELDEVLARPAFHKMFHETLRERVGALRAEVEAVRRAFDEIDPMMLIGNHRDLTRGEG
jgi:hypothetical protein